MGPGIFTKYSRQVIGGLLAVFVFIAALAVYYHLRGNVRGISPYETVNDLYEQELLSMTTDRESYPAEVSAVEVTLRNGASDYILIQDAPHTDEWVLEREVEGVWRSLRTKGNETIRWFGFNGGVYWGGEEETYVCDISRNYKPPLEGGTYRIVFPNMMHQTSGHLAVEFTVEG